MSAFKSQKRKTPIKNELEPSPKNIKVEPSPAGKTPVGKKNIPNQNQAVTPKLQSFKGTPKIKAEGAANADSKQSNRHKLRRAQTKEKRQQSRVRFIQIKQRAISGDQSARDDIKAKIDSIESEATLSKSKKRKLAVLKRILNNDGKQKKKSLVLAPKKGQQEAQKPQGQKKGNIQAPKQQNGKVAKAKVTPAPVKVEDDDEDSDEDEEEEEEASDEEDQEESGEDGEEQASDEEDEDEEDEDDEDAEEGSEEEDDADDVEAEDSDNESSEEETAAPTIGKKNAPKQGPPQKQGKQPISPQANKSRYVLFVGNIAYTSTENDLRDHFKKVGEIADIRIPKQNDKPRGFAYIELKDEASYQKALSLHNSFLGGRKINVLYSQGGKKNSENQKAQIKAKNLKLHAMRKQGQLQGSVKENQKRAARRKNKQQKGT